MKTEFTYVPRRAFIPKLIVELYKNNHWLERLLINNYTYLIRNPRIKFVMPKRKRR